MKKILRSIGVLSLMSALTLSVQAAPLSTTSLTTQKNTITKMITDPAARTWIRTLAEGQIETAKYVNTRGSTNRADLFLLRKEILTSLSSFLTDIRQGAYSFVISDTEKQSIEKDILSYQQELVSYLRSEIEKAGKNDTKISSTHSMTVRAPNGSLDVTLTPYNIIVSKDQKNIELDLKLTASGSMREDGVTLSGSVMIDGNMKIIDRQVYFLIREVQWNPPAGMGMESVGIFLKGLRGDVYTMTLDETQYAGLSALGEDTVDMAQIGAALRVLETQSLLTPIAKKSDTFALVFSRPTIIALAQSMDETISPRDIEDIPALIQYQRGVISTRLYDTSSVTDLRLTRDGARTPTMTIGFTERGDMTPTRLEATITPRSIVTQGSDGGYRWSASMNPTAGSLSVRDADREIVKARYDSTGVSAWTYDISGIYENLVYDENYEKKSSEDILLHLWGSFREEYGSFPILRPASAIDLQKMLDAQ